MKSEKIFIDCNEKMYVGNLKQVYINNRKYWILEWNDVSIINEKKEDAIDDFVLYLKKYEK